MSSIIVDAGPIVALLRERDHRRDWAVRTFAALDPPFDTCEAVITEAMFLMRRLDGGPAAVLDMVAKNVLRLNFRADAEVLALRTLVARYASVPMSFADACLVRMSELDPRAQVLTLDSDFKVYRRAGRLAIPVIMPD